MYQLTKDNHFKFGYDYIWYRPRQSDDDRWMTSYGACERPAKDFKAECHATAALLWDTRQTPLTLLFSGGANLEVVLLAFHAQGIPLKVAICQFSDNLNIHDVGYAVVCCEQLGIKYDLIPLDVRKFFEAEIYRYAEASQSRIPQVCPTMWLADQVDGVPILGSGECHLVKRVPRFYVDGVSPYTATPWNLWEREAIAAWYRHFLVPGKERMAVPGFFQYTPEIMLAFLQEQRVVDLVNDRVIGKRSTVSSKFGIYRKYWPQLAPRKKYNGFERMDAEIARAGAELRTRWLGHASNYQTEYNDLIDMLNGRIEGPRGILYRNLPGYDGD